MLRFVFIEWRVLTILDEFKKGFRMAVLFSSELGVALSAGRFRLFQHGFLGRLVCSGVSVEEHLEKPDSFMLPYRNQRYQKQFQ